MNTSKETTLLKMSHLVAQQCITIGHVSKIVSILLSKLSDCPNTGTSLCGQPRLGETLSNVLVAHTFLQAGFTLSPAIHTSPGSVCKTIASRRLRLRYLWYDWHKSAKVTSIVPRLPYVFYSWKKGAKEKPFLGTRLIFHIHLLTGRPEAGSMKSAQ